MKKYIYLLLTLFGLFMISGCGGGSDNISNSGNGSSGDTSGDSALKVEPGAIVVSANRFTLKMPIVKKVDSSYKIKLDNFNISVEGCTLQQEPTFSPNILHLNDGIDSYANIDINGTFDQNCTASKYTFSAMQTTTRDGKTDKRMFSVKYNSNNSGGGTSPAPSNGFFNATTPLKITQANSPYEIKVQVIKDGYAIEGKEVKAKSFDFTYGSISNPTAITGEDGYVVFNYMSPIILPANGTHTLLQLTNDENGSISTQDIRLDFNAVNSGIDTNVSVPIVVISNSYKNIKLISNNQNVQMEIQVFNKGNNTPYTTGNVKVSLPNSVLNGTDVGHFTEYVVPVSKSGIATFNYTGPQDIKELVDTGEKGATFNFYHENNTISTKSIVTTYDLSNNYIPVNYILNTSSSDGKQTMGLKTVKSFTFYLKDDKGSLIDDTKITQVTIESKNTLVGKLVDSANGGANTPSLTFNGDDAVNSKSFSVQTYTLSGLVPIEITIKFNDANGVSKILSKNMNIVVLSGPPTAMSISYAGVEQNSTIAKYIEKFAVTVTDTYNNPVNTRPYVSVGSMVEYAVDGISSTGIRNTTSPRLWHGLNDAHGKLEGIGGNKAQFTTTSNVFNYVDINNDKLVLFGSSFVYEALGKWDIASIANTALQLKDDYSGSDRSGLFFAAGHNNRQDQCKTDGTEYVGIMKANNYQLDENGNALIEFVYDYQLTGKDIMIWVNLTGYQADNGNTGRIGEAKKHTLRGNGLISRESYVVKSGTTGVALHFNVHHENAPEWYRNGHFGFAYEGCKIENIIDTSNNYDARSCNNSGIVYVDLNVSNLSLGDCTISLVDIAVANEFNGVTYP